MTKSWFTRQAEKLSSERAQRRGMHVVPGVVPGSELSDTKLRLIEQYIERCVALGYLLPPEQVLSEGALIASQPPTPPPAQVARESRLIGQTKRSSRFIRCYVCDKPAIDRLPGHGQPVCVDHQKPQKIDR